MTCDLHSCRASLVLTVVIGSLIGGVAQRAAAEEPGASRAHRVRSNGDPSIATLIQEASARSATFRGLVEVIDATDGIVYVEQGKCGHSVRACLNLSVVVAGSYRILRIVVDTRRERLQLMAAVGHELQHAVEVLSNPKLTSAHAVYMFFMQEGPTGSERFETPAAIHAGLKVDAELRKTK